MESLTQFVKRLAYKDDNPHNREYYVYRVASLTGFSKRDVSEALFALMYALEESIEEVYKDPAKTFYFGPFVIKARKVPAKKWKNPANGKTYENKERIIPMVRFREYITIKYANFTEVNKNFKEKTE